MQFNFDASQVAPATGTPDPLPAGDYSAKITETDIVPTADGTGKRLKLIFEVIEGQYAGRKVFEGLNIENKNPKAMEIAHEQLSAICHAVNVLNLQDTQQLHNLPLTIKVKHVPPKDGYDAKNEISKFSALVNGGVAPQQGFTQQPAMNQPPQNGMGQPPAQNADLGQPTQGTQGIQQNAQASMAPNGQPMQQVPIQNTPVQNQGAPAATVQGGFTQNQNLAPADASNQQPNLGATQQPWGQQAGEQSQPQANGQAQPQQNPGSAPPWQQPQQ